MLLPRLDLAEYETGMFLETTCRLRETKAFVTHDFIVDADGAIYLAAVAEADLAGLTSFGQDDALVAKLSASGEPVWVDRFGSQGLLVRQAEGCALARLRLPQRRERFERLSPDARVPGPRTAP